MKIVYINVKPFGRFYFDIATHRGVAIDDHIGPVVIGMKEDYEPLPSDPGFRKYYEIGQGVFNNLLAAADKRDRPDALEVIKQYFPETLEDEPNV